MTNEEKAIELACNKCACGYNFEEKKKCGHFIPVFEMAQWKDEQFAQEKQKLIDEACVWLTKNDSYAIPTNVQVDRLREYLNNIMTLLQS